MKVLNEMRVLNEYDIIERHTYMSDNWCKCTYALAMTSEKLMSRLGLRALDVRERIREIEIEIDR